MSEWNGVNDYLPTPDVDIWATDGIHVEKGFITYADDHESYWFDFWFPVSHWLPCTDDTPPMLPITRNTHR